MFLCAEFNVGSSFTQQLEGKRLENTVDWWCGWTHDRNQSKANLGYCRIPTELTLVMKLVEASTADQASPTFTALPTTDKETQQGEESLSRDVSEDTFTPNDVVRSCLFEFRGYWLVVKRDDGILSLCCASGMLNSGSRQRQRHQLLAWKHQISTNYQQIQAALFCDSAKSQRDRCGTGHQRDRLYGASRPLSRASSRPTF